MDRIRNWLVAPTTSDPEREAVTSRLERQADRLRVARIDAGLPVERRKRTVSTEHPTRRWNDG